MMHTLVRLTEVEMHKFWRKPAARLVAVLLFIGPIGAEILLALADRPGAVFPNATGTLFASSVLLCVALATVLVAVLALGNDYELGTVRPILSRGVARYQFILSKVVTTVVAAVANGLAYVAGGLLAISVAHVTYSDVPLFEAAGSDIFWRALEAVLVIGLVGFVSAGVVMLALVLGRSAWMGMLAGLGFFLADFWTGGLGLVKSDIYRYTVSYHALSLLERIFPASFTQSWVALSNMASPGRAATTLLLYGCALTLAAILVFQRQDLMGKV